MKTPMQELINQVEEWMLEDKEVLENPLVWSNYLLFQANTSIEAKLEFIDMCKEMLEKEKEVIVNAYIGATPISRDFSEEEAEQYYNETFNTKEG
jgi:hypothetical protein